jgi:hypothetical protein
MLRRLSLGDGTDAGVRRSAPTRNSVSTAWDGHPFAVAKSAAAAALRSIWYSRARVNMQEERGGIHDRTAVRQPQIALMVNSRSASRIALAEELLEGSRLGSEERHYFSFGERARQDHREVVQRRRRPGACQCVCPESSNDRLLEDKLPPV